MKQNTFAIEIKDMFDYDTSGGYVDTRIKNTPTKLSGPHDAVTYKGEIKDFKCSISSKHHISMF